MALPCAATYWRGIRPSAISHCPKSALSEPVAGSSFTPVAAANTRTSSCASSRDSCTAAAPTLMPIFFSSAWSGVRLSSVCGLSSKSASHGVPTSSICATRSCAAFRPKAAQTCASAEGAGALRLKGGAVNARRALLLLMVTKPTAHSCTTTPACLGAPPALSHASQVPSVGWPANGSSPPGVKMRTA